MELVFSIVITCLLLAIICIQLFVKKKDVGFFNEFDSLEKGLLRIENNLKEDARLAREENNVIARQNREELSLSLEKINKTLEEKVTALIDKTADVNRANRQELKEQILEFQKQFEQLQREKFADMERKQEALLVSTEKRLEEMRQTVDEKLQKTLNERISQSFKLVSDQLESVQKGLGEMQNLAQDVGGLKKVLSGVKTRGTFGEVQLSMLLEQMLSPEQYEANVKTKRNSNDLVEFAIKLPGKDDQKSVVYLPIDAKFPKDAFENYISALDLNDSAQIEITSKQLEATIINMAKDIHDKYIDPPNTTDFAILFLPFENIYAEVIRRTALMEKLQRQYKIAVTGPTTLGAILNSLQMGFRTLAIQQRSSEVWKVLSAVKTEFGKFGDMLEKVQKNISQAGDGLETIIGTRTRAIQRQLRNIEELPSDQVQQFLPDVEDVDN